MKQKVITLWRLGLLNLIWVACYRLVLKLGLFTRIMKIGPSIKGPFFRNIPLDIDPCLNSLDLKVFGWIQYSKQTPPLWNQSVTSNKHSNCKDQHWAKISDFDLDIGDIKTVWELSRFDWILHFVIEYIKTGDRQHLSILNEWLEDWSTNNPVNQGVNWKCGQEASFRVMHLCLASLLLKQNQMLSPPLTKMLEQHLARISPTLLYAMAQDNNHGTSEAVALYIGGLLLENNTSNKHGSKWKIQGRYWIENRLKRLIANDGSFSQYSVNYHRVMLDSLSLAEIFRRQYKDRGFSQLSIFRLKKATDWLRAFTDEASGDAPNLGANDGARIIPLSNTDYRDYRPSIQLSSVLFYNKRSYTEEGDYNQPLRLLSLNAEEVMPALKTEHLFDEGGYVHIKKEHASVYMRYPRFNFRPSQCDALHVDFWLNGKNILRDSGSYSYNAEQCWMNYFTSTKAHNTIQFDSKEQMPSLSRFLYGDWLKTSFCSGVYYDGESTFFKVGFKSPKGFKHYREVALSPTMLLINDDIGGFKNQAVVSWRLIPDEYHIQENVLIGSNFKIAISADVEIVRFELVEGWESRYYLKKTKLPVLELEVAKPTKIFTKIYWESL